MQKSLFDTDNFEEQNLKYLIMETIIIHKKKFWPTIWLLFMLSVLSMFLYASILGLTKKQHDFWYDYIFLLVFLTLSIVGLVYGLIYASNAMKKILSSSPEFELNSKEIVIFDNPKYDRFPFKEMIEANVYSSRYTMLIGISFKPNSNYGFYLNNLQRKVRNISVEKSKIVFISLEFADVKANVLRDFINERIKLNN